MTTLEQIKADAQAVIEAANTTRPCINHFSDKLYTEQAQTILRLVAALEKAVEQRDGYRDNYMVVMRLIDYDKFEIIKDNTQALEKILRGE